MYLRDAAVPNIPAGFLSSSCVSKSVDLISDRSSLTMTNTLVAASRRCCFHDFVASALS
jgi:hypothetical protein